ncbi:hypothetical protein PLESTF_001389800 [Pleodorina starrii]|nr:hypothetical protein PLESTF_001389800 [Pleodorina starrii]
MDNHVGTAFERVTMEAVATSHAVANMGPSSTAAAAAAAAVAAKLMPAERQVREAKRRLQEAETLLSKFPRYRANDYAVEESDLRRSLILNTTESQFRWDKAFSWLLSLIIGVLNGIAGFAFTQGINWLNRAKFETTLSLIRPGGPGIWPYLTYLAFSVAYALGGALLGSYVSPQAAGSGIPEIRCYLNGIHVRGLLTVRTFFAKSFGVVLSVASGLVVGKEGPFTHVGAILGGGVGHLGSTSLTRATGGQMRAALQTRFGRYFKSAVSHRDYVAAGASAGVASAFAAPIGGILFSVEQLLRLAAASPGVGFGASGGLSSMRGASFYNLNMLSHAFLSAGIAVYVSALLQAAFSEGASLYKTAMTTKQAFVLLSAVPDNTRLWYYSWELPIFAVMGVLGGLLGAAMVALNNAVTRLRRRFVPPTAPARRVAEVISLAVLTATAWFLASYLSPCGSYPPKYMLIDNQGNETGLGNPAVLYGGYYPQLWCPNGTYNEYGTLFFMPQSTTITMLFQYQLPSGASFIYNIGAMAALFTVGWLFMSVTFGIGTVTGLFVPSLLVGGAGGRLMGRLVRAIMLHLGYQNDNGTGVINICLSAYAIVGAGALMGGVSRMLLCNTVLVMETAAANILIMPLIVTTFIAKAVADLLTPVGIFDVAIQRAGYPYLAAEPPELTDIKMQHALTAGDVMSANLATLPARLPVSQLVEALRRYPNFSTFPLTEPPAAAAAPAVAAAAAAAFPEATANPNTCCGASSSSDSGTNTDGETDGTGGPLRGAATTTTNNTNNTNNTNTTGASANPANDGAVRSAADNAVGGASSAASMSLQRPPLPLPPASPVGCDPQHPRGANGGYSHVTSTAATPAATPRAATTRAASPAPCCDREEGALAAAAAPPPPPLPPTAPPPASAARRRSWRNALHPPPHLQQPTPGSGASFLSAFAGGIMAAAVSAVPAVLPAEVLRVVGWAAGGRTGGQHVRGGGAGEGAGAVRLGSISAPLPLAPPAEALPGGAEPPPGAADGRGAAAAAAEVPLFPPAAAEPPQAAAAAAGVGVGVGGVLIGTISRSVLLKLLEMQLEISTRPGLSAFSVTGTAAGKGASAAAAADTVAEPQWLSRRRAAMSRQRAARLMDALDNYPAKAPSDREGEELLFGRLGPGELARFLDLRHYMQRVPYIVPATASLARTYRLFRGLGLHHIFVTAPNIPIIGLITRTDIAPPAAYKAAYRLAQREQAQLQEIMKPPPPPPGDGAPGEAGLQPEQPAVYRASFEGGVQVFDQPPPQQEEQRPWPVEPSPCRPQQSQQQRQSRRWSLGGGAGEAAEGERVRPSPRRDSLGPLLPLPPRPRPSGDGRSSAPSMSAGPALAVQQARAETQEQAAQGDAAAAAAGAAARRTSLEQHVRHLRLRVTSSRRETDGGDGWPIGGGWGGGGATSPSVGGEQHEAGGGDDGDRASPASYHGSEAEGGMGGRQGLRRRIRSRQQQRGSMNGRAEAAAAAAPQLHGGAAVAWPVATPFSALVYGTGGGGGGGGGVPRRATTPAALGTEAALLPTPTPTPTPGALQPLLTETESARWVAAGGGRAISRGPSNMAAAVGGGDGGSADVEAPAPHHTSEEPLPPTPHVGGPHGGDATPRRRIGSALSVVVKNLVKTAAVLRPGDSEAAGAQEEAPAASPRSTAAAAAAAATAAAAGLMDPSLQGAELPPQASLLPPVVPLPAPPVEALIAATFLPPPPPSEPPTAPHLPPVGPEQDGALHAALELLGAAGAVCGVGGGGGGGVGVGSGGGGIGGDGGSWRRQDSEPV